jgi:hypothetical protein
LCTQVPPALLQVAPAHWQKAPAAQSESLSQFAHETVEDDAFVSGQTARVSPSTVRRQTRRRSPASTAAHATPLAQRRYARPRSKVQQPHWLAIDASIAARSVESVARAPHVARASPDIA